MLHDSFLNKQLTNWDAFNEESEDVVYYGFCKRGTKSFAEKKWCIIRHSKAGGSEIHQWSNGSQEYTEDFQNLSSKNYSFLK